MRISPFVTVLLLAALAGPTPAQSKKELRYRAKPIGYWVQELENQDGGKREEARRAVLAFGAGARAAVPALKRMLEDLSPEYRQFAVTALGSLGKLAEPAVPELIKLLDDSSNLPLRKQASIALGNVGPSAAKALPALKKIVLSYELPKDRNEYLEREHYLYVMTRIGAPAVGTLSELLDSQVPETRQHVVLAFEALGPTAVKAAPRLEKLLEDESRWVRFAAARALWKIAKHKDVVPAFVDMINEEGDMTLRTEIAWTLSKMGPDAKDALPALQKLVAEANKDGAGPRNDNFHATVLNAIYRIDPKARERKKLGTGEEQEEDARETKDKTKDDKKSQEEKSPAKKQDDKKPAEQEERRLPDVDKE